MRLGPLSLKSSQVTYSSVPSDERYIHTCPTPGLGFHLPRHTHPRRDQISTDTPATPAMPPRLSFTPPLLNSATPWATSAADLAALYASPHTGAVTTRTSQLSGFPEDPAVHQKLLFAASSLNTYGYSPHPLRWYLDAIAGVIRASRAPQTKPFIVSVAGTPPQLRDAVLAVAAFAAQTTHVVLVEINLSCPNIPGKPPPAYDLAELLLCLEQLEDLPPAVPLGLKTPPYTHDAEYRVLLDALKQHPRVVSFITSTNTLGSALHVSRAEAGGEYRPTLGSAAGTGIGGLGGACIHWLSLGNVATIRRMLDAEDALRGVVVIGVGGVADRDAYERMLSVGAVAVGVGTALGEHGVGVFARILGV